MNYLKKDEMLERAIYFAGCALDGEVVVQNHFGPCERKKVDKRACEISSSKETFIDFRVMDIYRDDRQKYIDILAYMAFS